MPQPNSAEAIQNSVESAETLKKPQLVDADTTETSVDSDESIEQSSDDLMGLLLGDDIPEEDAGKSVSEGQYLKLKEKAKTMKQELERLRSQVTPPQQPQLSTDTPLPTLPDQPDPTKYDDGVYDPKYQNDLLKYQQSVIAKTVQEKLVQEKAQMEASAYLSKYQERIDKTLPIANMRIEELKKKDDGFRQRMESPYFRQALSNLPPEALAAITESSSPESLVNYYTHKPERLYALTNNSIDELLNLGMLIGKINGTAGIRKPTSKPIKPIKSGTNTSKLHPIRDHAKYDHSTPEGHRKWELDMEKLNTRR